MASHEFFFALEFSSHSAPASLLEHLAERVFKHVGCAIEHVEGLSGAIERASGQGGGAAERRCDVQFRAQEGELEVLVTADGDRVWQTSILLS